MSKPIVSRDKVVSFTYSIQDAEGNIVEQSDLPISYVHGGQHDLFEKIEVSLEGCAVGDTVKVALTPEEGFGQHDENLTYTDDLDNVPPEFRRIGAEVEMMNDQGETRKFIVTHIENDKLTVDGNHPLAGKIITFNIKVADIRDASPDELARGVEPMATPVMH
ncbi:MAG: FKBP-type peptidyl-prolyl cis-trans isomerase [Gammaproteobacteria bacterium]|nr:FKBP-type peptidyl-prolyl cis-trans isomerase [Gammaproteobacteria bacterium]